MEEKDESIAKPKVEVTASFFSEKDHPQGDIEDATKPTIEATATTIDLRKRPEEDSDVLPPFAEEADKEDNGSALRNVRIEASISETTNLGNMEFCKIAAVIAGDVGRKGREAAWKEAWGEVEHQKAEELIRILKARIGR